MLLGEREGGGGFDAMQFLSHGAFQGKNTPIALDKNKEPLWRRTTRESRLPLFLKHVK